MPTTKTKQIYSVFSGTYYEIPEKDIKLLDDGQLPLTEKPKNCSKCYNRGYIGRDKNTLVYEICNCVKKKLDVALIKDIHSIE